jgi:hypothetical protein
MARQSFVNTVFAGVQYGPLFLPKDSLPAAANFRMMF